MNDAGKLMNGARAYAALFFLAALTCSAFAFLASAAALYTMRVNGIDEEPGFYLRLAVKLAGFAILTAGTAYGLVRTAPRPTPTPSPPDSRTPIPIYVQAVLLGLVAALLVPSLTHYPYTAPDELHHLIVARNFAEHDAYASGNPDAGFKYLDEYDSIGVVGITWVTSAFDVFGTSLLAARLAIVVTAMLLFAATIQFVSAYTRVRGVVLAHGLALTAIGTIYLGRTYYGEVPAFAFLVGGMCVWRDFRFPRLGAALAGTFFALAALIKTFILLAAVPMLVVFLYDRLTHRRIPLPRVGCAIVGFAVLYGAVALALGNLAERLSVSQPDMMLYYRHYFLFGFDGAPAGVRWLMSYPGVAVGLGVGLVYGLYASVVRRYRPELLILVLTGILFVFWWLFFTPGTIPRYLWYSSFVAAALCGIAIDHAIQFRPRNGSLRWRAGIGVVVLTLAVSHGRSLIWETERIIRADEMEPNYALLAYLDELPADQSVHTLWWPVERMADFFISRTVPTVDDPLDTPGLYVFHREHQPHFSAVGEVIASPGPYGILRVEPDALVARRP